MSSVIILGISRSDAEHAETVSERIRRCIAEYNDACHTPFNLGVSLGYAVYDYRRHLTAEEFRSQLDQLMYEDKRAKKEKAAVGRTAAYSREKT